MATTHIGAAVVTTFSDYRDIGGTLRREGFDEVLHPAAARAIERRPQRLDQRLRRASFESDRTLEDFDFLFNPTLPKSKIIDLATCAYLERHHNVLLIGPTGTGKSHIAQALGHRACRAGHAVLYVTAQDLLKQLRAARARPRFAGVRVWSPSAVMRRCACSP